MITNKYRTKSHIPFGKNNQPCTQSNSRAENVVKQKQALSMQMRFLDSLRLYAQEKQNPPRVCPIIYTFSVGKPRQSSACKLIHLLFIHREDMDEK